MITIHQPSGSLAVRFGTGLVVVMTAQRADRVRDASLGHPGAFPRTLGTRVGVSNGTTIAGRQRRTCRGVTASRRVSPGRNGA